MNFSRHKPLLSQKLFFKTYIDIGKYRSISHNSNINIGYWYRPKNSYRCIPKLYIFHQIGIRSENSNFEVGPVQGDISVLKHGLFWICMYVVLLQSRVPSQWTTSCLKASVWGCGGYCLVVRGGVLSRLGCLLWPKELVAFRGSGKVQSPNST